MRRRRQITQPSVRELGQVAQVQLSQVQRLQRGTDSVGEAVAAPEVQAGEVSQPLRQHRDALVRHFAPACHVQAREPRHAREGLETRAS